MANRLEFLFHKAVISYDTHNLGRNKMKILRLLSNAATISRPFSDF